MQIIVNYLMQIIGVLFSYLFKKWKGMRINLGLLCGWQEPQFLSRPLLSGSWGSRACPGAPPNGVPHPRAFLPTVLSAFL